MNAARPPHVAHAVASVEQGKTFTVLVNGAPQPTTARTLAQWVEAQGLAGNALATAVNGNFVPRTLRAQQPLAEGDIIVTFQPIEGG